MSSSNPETEVTTRNFYNTEAEFELSRRLGKLRTRRALGRFLHILTFALAANLILDVCSLLLYNVVGWKLYFPYFFELLFVILFLGETHRLRMEEFCKNIDRNFCLKDRLYSFLWYRKPGNVSAEILQAQAEESLRSIDFSSIGHALRIRIPQPLYMVLPLFLLLLYLSWNSDYQPPGVTSRMVQETLTTLDKGPSDRNKEEGEKGQDLAAGRDERNSTPDGAGLPESAGSGRDSVPPGHPDAQGTSPGVTPPSAPLVDTGGAGAEKGAGGPPGKELAAPDIIESIPVTDKVSPPVPADLEATAEGDFATLPEAEEFLSLIPGQGDKGVTPLDESVIENFRTLVDRYPPRYHEQLENYYRELLE